MALAVLMNIPFLFDNLIYFISERFARETVRLRASSWDREKWQKIMRITAEPWELAGLLLFLRIDVQLALSCILKINSNWYQKVAFLLNTPEETQLLPWEEHVENPLHQENAQWKLGRKSYCFLALPSLKCGIFTPVFHHQCFLHKSFYYQSFKKIKTHSHSILTINKITI